MATVAAAAAPAASAASAADQATDLFQKLALDSQSTAQDAAATNKNPGTVNGQSLSVSIPTERSITPLLPDFMDPNMFYLPAYYYGGYDGAVSEWEEYPRYVNPDGVEIAPAAFYGDIYQYGYAPYGAYSSASSPVPTVGHDGQLFGTQHYQYPTAYFQPPTPAHVPNQASNTQGGLSTSVAADKAAAHADTAKTNSNITANGTAHGNSGSVSLGSRQQNSSLTPNGTYSKGAAQGGYTSGYLDSTYGFDGTGHYPWYDASIYSNGYHKTATTSSMTSSNNASAYSLRSQTQSPSPQLGAYKPRTAMGSASPVYSNGIYPNTGTYGQYANSYKTGLSFGSTGYDSRLYGRWGLGMDKYKPRGRGNGFYGFGNESQDGTIELNRGPRSGRFKNQKMFGHAVSLVVKGQGLPSAENKASEDAVPDRTQYNRDDFPEQYAAAKFFVIKSYSEDDVHKSVKYGVWASTTNGNKKLDAAYKDAQAKGGECPVFLFFSVNTSGQFVGVAEMVGPVDFEKTLEYWQQDKWNGSFPLKWHIVKDVPNNVLKHIILENNENKPVTNSRDTQEINLEQGLQMLKIFKSQLSKTSILDDFAFYENRQKLMHDKRTKQQQFQKQVWDASAVDSLSGDKEKDGAADGKPRLHKPYEPVSILSKDAAAAPPAIAVEPKLPENNNAVAPAATYAAKVAKPAIVANGVTKG